MKNWFSRARKTESHRACAALRVPPDVKASVHPNGVVLIHMSKGAVFSANRAGALIWNAATRHGSLDNLAQAISGEFQVPRETAERDAADFLEELKAEGLLIADGN
jgi:hypothetical protein